MITSPVKITDSVARHADKAIELRSVGKQYYFKKTPDNNAETATSAFWALKDVSLDIYKGRILGIIGRNGAGKTTLLNIMAGILSPTRGEVVSTGKVLGLFNLGVGFQDELTGRENIFLNGAIMGASRKGLNVKLADIISFSELGDFIDMPLASYSQGMRLRLGFSIVTHLDFDALVIDEVLAVGDGLFQNKCFERLADFRRAGKALVVTTQSLDIIQRLCDRVVFLDHGAAIFEGAAEEAVNKYRGLLNSEKFFVGPAADNRLVTTTKKWADDVSCWGNKFGTKEVVIDAVDFINKFGFKCAQVKSGEPLKIKVSFTAREDVREPHFGVAIFRKDGVYCYGVNTGNDIGRIDKLRPGRGHFAISYKALSLAPGEYRVSVAVWDKDETLAFDYHNSYYKLKVTGYDNLEKELLNISLRRQLFSADRILARRQINRLRLSSGRSVDDVVIGIDEGATTLEDALMYGSCGERRNIFRTNEKAVLEIKLGRLESEDKRWLVRVGIYRDDGIYCQGFSAWVVRTSCRLRFLFSSLPLLPGGYKVSLEVVDTMGNRLLMRRDGVCSFRMVTCLKDHGTVYLWHKWQMRLP